MLKLDADESSTFHLVLEVEPWLFSTRPFPHESEAFVDPEDWDAYFAACLSDAGLPPVDCLSGSRFVPEQDILHHPLLLRLVLNHLSGSGLPGFPDEEGREDGSIDECVTPLGGGICLIHAGKRWLEPAFSGDLSHIDNWCDVIESGFGQGTLWIGHPALHFEARRGTLSLSEQTSEALKREPRQVQLSLSLGERKMNDVIRQRDELEEALRSTLQRNERTGQLGELASYLVGRCG